jgi:hypothetical protein
MKMPRKPVGNSPLHIYLKQLHEVVESHNQINAPGILTNQTTKGTARRVVKSATGGSGVGNDKPVWL